MHTHPHTQSWLISIIPQVFWVRLTMYFNTTARKRCLNEAKLTRGGHLFSRRVYRHAHPRSRPPAPIGRPSSDLSLRRTPSPHRRVSTVEPPSMPSVRSREGVEGSSVDLTTRPAHTEDLTMTPFRTDTGSSFGSMPSPIPEGHMTSTPLHTPDTPSARSREGHAGVFKFSPSETGPLRSLSATSAESAPRSPSLRRLKHSRVLVVPSVATVTFVPQSPAASKPLRESKD